MGPQTALPRMILLLFFLHLLSEGGRSHPVDRADQASDQLGMQELLYHLGDNVSETQAEHTTPEQHQQGSSSTEGWKAEKATPKSTLQAFKGPQIPNMKEDTGCFGRTRMDRIDSFTGLGCNVLRRP